MATVKNLTITTLGATSIALGLGGAVQAATVTFDENELQPGQPIDNVSFKGITFDFKVDGVDSTTSGRVTDSVNNFYSPIAVQGRTLSVGANTFTELRNGVLTLDFAAPTPVLSFDFVTGGFSGNPAVTVELFDPTLTSLGVRTGEGTSGKAVLFLFRDSRQVNSPTMEHW